MFAVSTFCGGTPLSEKKNEVIVLSLIIRLFTCVILLGVAVFKGPVRCGSKRVNAAPFLEATVGDVLSEGKVSGESGKSTLNPNPKP
jgi:hypothetical protein